MKICVISNLFPPHMRGGAERVAYRIARGLVERGHEVSVISTRPRRTSVQESEEEGMKVYRFRPQNLYYTLEDRIMPFWKRLIWHVYDLLGKANAKKVISVVDSIKPDLVITHNLKGIGVQIPTLIQGRYPHLHLLHDVQLVIPSGLLIKGEENNWLNNGPLQKMYEQAANKALGEPDLILSPSQFLLDYHLEHGFFPNSASKVLPNPAPEFGGFGREKPTGSVNIVYLGSLEEHKGIKFMVESLRSGDLDFQLTLAGKGSLDTYAGEVAAADNRIKFFGAFTLEQAAELLSNADCFVVPSLCYENSPTVIYEGLSCGVPVVAAKIGGISELVDEGENGYLFEAGNSKSMLEQLARVHQERDHWFVRSDEIIMQTSKWAMTNYLDRFETILKEIKQD